MDTDFFQPGDGRAGRHALVVSALVPYKRIDLAIDACRAAGVPLRIAGDGPELGRLRKLAGDAVTFLGPLSNEDIRAEYRGASIVLLPGVEDFGIVPLEAQACGTPVVATARGGALETVVDGVTGVLVKGDALAAFAEAIRQAMDTSFDTGAIRAQAARFGRGRFADEIRACLDRLLTSA